MEGKSSSLSLLRSCPESEEIRFKMVLKSSQDPSFTALSGVLFTHYISMTDVRGDEII